MNMKVFVTADLHLGHKNIVKFTKDDGSKLRPWDTVEEHDEALIQNWNETVRYLDKVYVLGDFTMNPKYITLGHRLNGNKILIKGNHDTGKLSQYAEVFSDVLACMEKSHGIFSHIPVHEDQLRRYRFNIHGHLHDEVVLTDKYDMTQFTVEAVSDPRYRCVSVEQTNFKPIEFDEIIEDFKREGILER